MTATEVERTIWIDAPRDHVWQSLTHPDHIIQWFVPNLPGASMQLDETGTVTIHLGPMGVEFLTLNIVAPLHQATMRGLPDGVVTATYTLKEENGGTEVTTTVNGFHTLVSGVNAERLSQITKGWEQTLNNLKAHIGGTALPFPHAFVGPLFGYWQDEPKKASLERSIWIAAPRERVWRAITDPKQLQLWLSPATEWQLSALEIGGRLYVYNAEEAREMHVEIIELLDPPHQFATRTLPEAPDTIEKEKLYTLTEEKGGTRLSILLTGYEQEAEGTRGSHMEENAFGFGMMLQNAKAYLEGQELPFPWGF